MNQKKENRNLTLERDAERALTQLFNRQNSNDGQDYYSNNQMVLKCM